ncbi:sulfotransferase domain-containing protein [soil metagenome]
MINFFKRFFPSGADNIVVLASAHKVGSTWLFNLLKDIGLFEKPLVPDHLNDSGTLMLDQPETKIFLSQTRGRKIFKSHSFPVPISDRGGAKFISVYRDPRDVIISGTFYLSNLPKEKGGWDEEQRALSDKEKIKYFIAHGTWCIDRLKAWYNDKDTCQVKYELLLLNTFAEVKKVTHFLDLKVSDKQIRAAIELNLFSKKAGRKQGEEDKFSFYRKGISGDWKNYFDDELKALFKTAMDSQWNKLLIEMGYETGSDW